MSEAIDDYLKAIYQLSEEDSPAGPRRISTGELAVRLGISAASVSGMLKRLSVRKPRLLDYGPHEGVRLSPAGRSHALKVLRRHRVIELFLHEKLGFSWDEVHEQADRLEHAASDEFTDRLASFLGSPETDPHGELIPNADGTLPVRSEIALQELPLQAERGILRVTSPNPDELRYLADRGIVPGAKIQIESRDPFGGSWKVLVEGILQEVGPILTSRIFVETS
jgi:DtxR family Mn-dependent transcriptional regulator